MERPTAGQTAVAILSLIYEGNRAAARELLGDIADRAELQSVTLSLAELGASLCVLAANLVNALDQPDTEGPNATGHTGRRIIEAYGHAAARHERLKRPEGRLP